MSLLNQHQIVNVIGTQWGDEGKGKIVDILAKDFDLIVRSAGGANAGHTIYVDDQKYIFHLIPSGILHPGKICLIGNGTVIHVPTLFQELERLSSSGIDFTDRLLISRRAHLIFSYHMEADKHSESKLGKDKIGTTCRGIGPAYLDKYGRTGVRVGDLEDLSYFEEKFRHNASLWQKRYGFEIDVDQEISFYKEKADQITPWLCDTEDFLWESLDKNKKILMEGAQGVHLDIDFGTYPFVTSSSTISAGACSGSGIPPQKIDCVIGIAKAYTTRVGAGVFPAELLDKKGDKLRDQGQEYGSTTGRPRRCGWFDAPAVRRAVRLSGIDFLNLTKLDVLTGLPNFKAVKSYHVEGQEVLDFPSNAMKLEKAQMNLEEFSGWTEDLSRIRHYDDLPDNAKKYVTWIEDVVGIPVKYIGVGPGREDLIFK